MAGLRPYLLAAVLGACGGGSSDSPPEVVVANASLGGTAPVVLGATSNTVLWSAGKLIGGAPLATLPAAGEQLAMAVGPAAAAGDFVVFASAANQISRVTLGGAVREVTVGAPEALAGNDEPIPTVAWTNADVVSWGRESAQTTATLIKVDRCDHARVTTKDIYVAADGATGRRVVRIDRETATVNPVTSSTTWAPMFPNGAPDGATYKGRIVDANDDGILWLVEESPSGRGIVVNKPVQGEGVVVLEHLSHATGFFTSADALYWQEGDELLTAPRAGGAASIVATLPGPAGALADGFIYFTDGSGIARLPVP